MDIRGGLKHDRGWQQAEVTRHLGNQGPAQSHVDKVEVNGGGTLGGLDLGETQLHEPGLKGLGRGEHCLAVAGQGSGA